jgi:hypothetical protein
MDLSRRGFIKLSAGAAAAGGTLAGAGDASALPPAGAHLDASRLLAQAGTPAPLGFNPADASMKYELVIVNGDVLDPVQKTRARRDIGIRFGQIAAVAPSIPADRAVQRIDAAGKLVTPGLIDLHTHLCPHLGIGLPADELVPITATTTAVSAGDAGSCPSPAPACSALSTSPPSAWPAGSPPARCSISSTPTWRPAPRRWRRTRTWRSA